MKMELIKQLGFDSALIDIDNVASIYPDFSDISKTEAEKVYFSAGKPAVLFLTVKCFDNTTLDKIAKVQHNIWNYQRVLLLYVVSDVEIRIYNCFGIPVNSTLGNDYKVEHLNSLQLAEGRLGENLDLLISLFSRINVDCGTLWISENDKCRRKIRREQRVDAYLIRCMTKAAQLLQEEKLDLDVIHSLLIRSLFILFLEDKGAAKEAGLYDSIKNGASSYFDILKDKESAYKLFRKLQEQFNGNITMMPKYEESVVETKHLKIISDCFYDGNFKNNSLFRERLFNFEIIHIGLISEIYETFLGELRNVRGQFYTPFALADMILTEVLPSSSIDYNYPLLDPACGSGVFLVEGYKRLIMRWKNAHPGTTISFDVLVSLLKENIFGIEIDKTAIRVTAFSLYLTLIDQLDPKTLWNSDRHRLPYLIYDPDDVTLNGKQGVNLLRRDTIKDVQPNDMPSMKLVVGNPPYGTKNLTQEIKNYCRSENFALEFVLPFMHKATLFSPNGKIALVCSSKVLFNTNGGYSRFREWLFTNNTVERLDNLSIFRKASKTFGGSLFSDATCPVCVVYYTPTKPSNDGVIKFCSPKTYIKSNLVDGLLIDESDIKMLPMTECQNPNSKIWKVAAWGNYYSYQLLHRLTGTNLKEYFDEHNWSYGRGLNSDSQHQDFIPSPIIKTECIARYWSNLSNAENNNSKKYRDINVDLFSAPYVAFKQGQHNGEIACSLFNENVYFTTTAFAFNGGSIEEKKILTAYLNSRLVKYILFLTTSSWGIEREQIFLNEVLDLPAPFEILSDDAKNRIVNGFDLLYQLYSYAVLDEFQINKIESSIEWEFEHAFKLTEKDIAVINDTLDINLEIFQHKTKAYSYHRTLLEEMKDYANVLSNSITSLLRRLDFKINITTFNVDINDPLQMVILQLNSEHNNIEIGDITMYRKSLLKIDKYLIQKHSESVYMKKTLKFYENNYVYIVKPNQKRFWSTMQAYDDVATIINDVLNM